MCVIAVLASVGVAGRGVQASTSQTVRSAQSHRSSEPRPHIQRLIGLSRHEARHKLKRQGITARFATFKDKCSGIPADGPVIRQVPTQGGRLFRKNVQLWTTETSICRSARAKSECQSADLKLSADGVGSAFPGTGGQTVAYARIKNTADLACQLKTTIYVRLEGTTAPVVGEIRGNPATSLVDLRLGPGKFVEVDWQWVHWCGSRPRANVVAAAAGQTDVGRAPAPACSRGEGASVLFANGIGP